MEVNKNNDRRKRWRYILALIEDTAYEVADYMKVSRNYDNSQILEPQIMKGTDPKLCQQDSSKRYRRRSPTTAKHGVPNFFKTPPASKDLPIPTKEWLVNMEVIIK